MKRYRNLLGIVFGITLATGTVLADVLVSKTGTFTGDVVRVEQDGVLIQQGPATFKVFKRDLLKLDIPKPAVVDTALAALKAGKSAEVIAALKPVLDRYLGLCGVAWVEQAMFALSDAYITAKDYSNARRILESFKQLCPDSALTGGLEVKFTRMLVEQKEYDKAIPALQAALGPLLKQEFFSDVEEVAVAEGLVLLGDCYLGKNALDDALDSYLKVVTLFDLDSDRMAEAQFKAAKVFERQSNWKRAKQMYGEVLKTGPKTVFAGQAKTRLETLTKDHPE